MIETSSARFLEQWSVASSHHYSSALYGKDYFDIQQRKEDLVLVGRGIPVIGIYGRPSTYCSTLAKSRDTLFVPS